MTLPELIDSLIELSTEEMPDKARQSLDDAIDHMVSSMTDLELNDLFQKGFEKIDVMGRDDTRAYTYAVRSGGGKGKYYTPLEHKYFYLFLYYLKTMNFLI